MDHLAKKIVLCADSESLIRPWLIGLDEVDFETLSWVEAFSKACDVRNYVREHKDVSCVWIVATDDIANLNLAAALRKDNSEIPIDVVLSKRSGSTLSKAKAAGITSVLSQAEFVIKFNTESNRINRLKEMQSDELSNIANFLNGEQKKAHIETFDQGLQSIASISSNLQDESMQTGNENRASTRDHQLLEGKKTDDVSLHEKAQNESVSEKLVISPSIKEGQIESRKETSNALVLPILSGSGGVGKSAFCAIASHYFAAKGLKTLVLDADLQFGDMRELISHAKVFEIDDVVDGSIDIADELGDEQQELLLLAAPKNMESSETVAVKLPQLLGELVGLFDVVVINTASFWSELQMELIELSTSPVFLVDQRASSIKSCTHAMDLCLRAGIATRSFVFALNRCSKNASLSSIDVSCALQRAHVQELLDGGHDVEELLASGNAEELLLVRNPFAASVCSLVDAFLPQASRRKNKQKVVQNGFDASNFDANNALSHGGDKSHAFWPFKKSKRRRGSSQINIGGISGGEITIPRLSNFSNVDLEADINLTNRRWAQ